MSDILLSYGACSASVSRQGAQITSFRSAGGREVIWQGDPGIWAQHAPVLFPVCGAVREEKIAIAGKTYPMAKHGFAMDSEFSVFLQGEDFVDLVLTPTAESRTMYPFDFAFHVSYRLFGDGYTTAFLAENRSDRVMPLCLGGHPGYVCPMEPGAAFEDYQLVFAREETGEITMVPSGGLADGTEKLEELRNGRVLSLSHALFDARDTLVFAGLNSRSVDLVHRKSGHGIRLDFPKMEVLAVWTMPGADAGYLCLEPWHGMPGRVQDSDSFEEKPFVTLLPPGRAYTSWFTASLI